MFPAPTLGNRSANCPEIECHPVCDPCEHKQYVFDQSLAFNGQSVNFQQLAEAMLDEHDEYVRELCTYVPDLCKQGELVNFPCFQCGLIQDVNCIEQGETVYFPQSCSGCICFKPLDFSNCEIIFVDLSAAPYTEVYMLMVQALRELQSGFAGGQTTEDFLRLFLPEASLMFFKDNAYHISIGPAEPEILAILPLLQLLAPIPIGARLIFYIACPT